MADSGDLDFRNCLSAPNMMKGANGPKKWPQDGSQAAPEPHKRLKMEPKWEPT